MDAELSLKYFLFSADPPCADRSKPDFRKCQCEDGTQIHKKGIRKHADNDSKVIYLYIGLH